MTSATVSITIPDLDEVLAFAEAGTGNIVAVYREVRADLETPVSAYLKVARGPYSFLLESVEGGERLGRYSFIGTEPYRVEALDQADGDPLLAIEDELGRLRSVPVPRLPRFHGGAVGYLGYEAVGHFERLPMPDHDVLGLPESWLMFADTLLVFDHLLHTIKVVSHVRLDGAAGIETEYERAVERIDELVSRLDAPLATLPYVALDGPVGRAVESNWAREDYLLAIERTKTVHRRRRRHPDSDLAALRARDGSARVRGLPIAARGQPLAVHVLPAVRRHGRGRRLPGAAREGRGGPRRRAPDRRHASAHGRGGRGPAAGRRAQARPQGAGRARDAAGPRAQRCGAGLGGGQRRGYTALRPRVVLARHAPRQPCRGRAARGHDRLRRAARDVPGRDGVGRAEDPSDGDHRGARARPPRPVRRRGRLLRLFGQRRDLHHDPHDGAAATAWPTCRPAAASSTTPTP